MNSKGFSLVEILLAVSVFGLIVTGLAGGLIYGQQSTVTAGMRSRAVILAEEGLEAVRNIRNAGFSNLTDGPHGLVVSGNNQWTLSETPDNTDIFTRTLDISPVDDSRKQVISTVTWPQTPQRLGEVFLITYLTNWNESEPVNTCDLYCQLLEIYSTGTCRQNPSKCTDEETYVSEGNPYCTGGENEDSCCCKS